MNTPNKIWITRFSCTVTMLYSGCSTELRWYEDNEDTFIMYRIECNARMLEVQKYHSKEKWSTVIPMDFTVNPLRATKEEETLISLMPGLSDFEISLYQLGCNLAMMWHNDADENYAKHQVKEYVKDYLELVI